jgi:sulfhydrogenase subunit beta (sulfur reductase)
MNRAGHMTHGEWRTFVEALSRRFQVYGPVKSEGVIAFKRLDGDEALCLDRPAQIGPKAVVFPQSETLFSFSMEKGEGDPQAINVSLDADVSAADSVVLCARPCDARGFSALDPVLLGKDPYYTERRERTAIIALACGEPFSGCFCTSVESGPADKQNSDILVTPLDEGYYLEILNDRGEALLEGADLKDEGSFREQADAVHRVATQRLKKVFRRLESYDLEHGLFRSEKFWEDVTERCLSCGACTYLCPTCHCFNITDELDIDSGERIRSWDSCMFPHYTRETSGHNPRAEKAHRFKNRIGHKFVYHPERYDEVLCSGCGRCIRYCPVSLNISHIVAQLTGGDEEIGHGDGI